MIFKATRYLLPSFSNSAMTQSVIYGVPRFNFNNLKIRLNMITDHIHGKNVQVFVGAYILHINNPSLIGKYPIYFLWKSLQSWCQSRCGKVVQAGYCTQRKVLMMSAV